MTDNSNFVPAAGVIKCAPRGSLAKSQNIYLENRQVQRIATNFREIYFYINARVL